MEQENKARLAAMALGLIGILGGMVLNFFFPATRQPGTAPVSVLFLELTPGTLVVTAGTLAATLIFQWLIIGKRSGNRDDLTLQFAILIIYLIFTFSYTVSFSLWGYFFFAVVICITVEYLLFGRS